jgi:MFS family permease
MIEERPEKKEPSAGGLRALIAMMPKELKALLVSDILIRFCEQMPYAYLAIWAMQSAQGARISGTEFGILTAIEMVVALLIYVPVAYLADKGAKKPFVVITFFNFTIFPVLLYFSTTFWMLVIAFVVRGLKEFGEPTRKALIMDLAPEGKKASTFGGYYLVRDTIVSLAAFAGAWLWQMSPGVNLGVAALFGALGTILFAVKGKERV